MTFAANQLAQILTCSVPYKPCSVGNLASILHNGLNKTIVVTYFTRIKNEKEKIVDFLESFEVKKIRDFNNNHTHNIIVLHLRKKGTMFFIDGDRNNSNAGASASGFILHVGLEKAHN